MLYKVYDHNGSVAKKEVCGRDPQGAWHQDEMIGSKLLLVK
jgi:hypothetical protein